MLTRELPVVRWQRFGSPRSAWRDYLLIVGGYPAPNEKGVNTAELFNPNTGKFIKIGWMKVAPSEFPATVIPSGE